MGIDTVKGLAIGAVGVLVGALSMSHYSSLNKKKRAQPPSNSTSSGGILSDTEFMEALETVTLTPKTIEIVKATAPVVAEHAVEITSAFYPLMFSNNPEALYYFNEANQNRGMQQQALAHAVVGYASNIDNLENVLPLLEVIAHRHCALSVTANLYPIVYKNLMLAIAKVLGDALTPDIVSAWSEAVVFLSKACIDTEAKLYKDLKQRKGGWEGEKEFVLVKKVKVADATMQFTFEPVGQQEGIDFTPGQYLTIRCPNLSPRHYTITSSPGESHLQCTVRLVPGGKVSTYMHEKLAVGDRVLLGAPSGLFSPFPDNDVVLISAGIGITPMYSFLKSLDNSRIKGIVHFEHTPKRMAFQKEFDASGLNPCFIFDKERKNFEKNISEQAKQLVANCGPSADYYLCGPGVFMSTMTKELKKNGAKSILSEVFGTGTTPLLRCPMSN